MFLVKTTVEEFTEEWDMETIQETGKEPEVKSRMQQVYKTTTATAEDDNVEAVTTGNIKRIDYSMDESGKKYVEKNEPILETQKLTGAQLLELTDSTTRETGVVEETKETLKKVKRRLADGTEEEVPQLEERTTETKRTAMTEVRAKTSQTSEQELEKTSSTRGPSEEVAETKPTPVMRKPEGNYIIQFFKTNQNPLFAVTNK